MRINGEWRQCDDGIVRPMIRGEIRAADGTWLSAEFLVDTGADCTVLSAALSSALGLRPIAPQGRLGGLGGTAGSVVLETEIHLPRDTGGLVRFSGPFAAVLELEALDISVLGRDITGVFAVIVDQPNGTVCLLRERHRYVIEEA
jgi:predicted aspartyl protease